jgi:hypothetical protein
VYTILYLGDLGFLQWPISGINVFLDEIMLWHALGGRGGIENKNNNNNNNKNKNNNNTSQQ